jgi:hypothetical protein
MMVENSIVDIFPVNRPFVPIFFGKMTLRCAISITFSIDVVRSNYFVEYFPVSKELILIFTPIYLENKIKCLLAAVSFESLVLAGSSFSFQQRRIHTYVNSFCQIFLWSALVLGKIGFVAAL